MRFDDVWVAGLGSWLPPAVSVGPALADGRYDPADQAKNEYASITVADAETGQSPPEMAVRAGRAALEQSGLAARDIAVVVHATLWYQGVDFWPVASYLHHELLGDAARYAPALELGQMSNGGLAAIELGAAYLAAAPARRAALITTADRLGPPGFDRWRSDLPGIVYGDGAAAVVLARRGFARLVSLVTVTDGSLEGMYRGDEPFGLVPGHSGYPLANRPRRTAYAAGRDLAELGARIGSGLADAVDGALSEARLKTADIVRAVFPNLGATTLRQAYLQPLGLDLAQTTWAFGQTTGHVGAADQILGLEYLHRGGLGAGAGGAGGRVLLVGIGAGFSWTGAVVEFSPSPDTKEGP